MNKKKTSTQNTRSIQDFFQTYSLESHLYNLDDIFCFALMDDFFQQTSGESFAMIMEIKRLLQALAPKQ